MALRLSNQRGVLVIKTRAKSKYRQVDGEDVTRGAQSLWMIRCQMVREIERKERVESHFLEEESELRDLKCARDSV